jgi:nucleotide-binding universal stress UspA family protein
VTVQTETTAIAIFDRIVCAVDGSPQSLEAARQAERLRTPDGILTLASVAEVNHAVHAGWAMSDLLGKLDATACAALERATHEVHPARTRMLAGDVAPRLLDEIERELATLVALGPKGHSRAAGMLFGGASTELLHNAPCSILLAREPQFGEFPLSVFAGVDGSAESLAAAAVAKEIAERFHAEYLVITATGGKHVDLEAVNGLGVDVVTDEGHPVWALAELSKEADLLVLGSRGLHGLRALGSISEQVAHRATCSVLVVRNI